jgi:hypothetical protein
MKYREGKNVKKLIKMLVGKFKIGDQAEDLPLNWKILKRVFYEMKYEDGNWIRVNQYKIQWQTSVNTRMNLRVSQKQGISSPAYELS